MNMARDAWGQDLYIRLRLYARYHVLYAVVCLLLSTVLFLFNINAFINPPRSVSRPPGWEGGDVAESKRLRSIFAGPPQRASDAEGKKQRLTLVVLTCNRPKSLSRLLTSLASAKYERGTRTDMIVRQDMPENGVLCPETSRMVHRMFWPHGTLEHVKEEVHRGAMHMWMHSYSPSSATDYFLVLEDDMEVSAFYHRWLLSAIEQYRMDSSVFALSVSRPIERGVDPLGLGPVSNSVPQGVQVVKYRVPTLQGLSPMPREWEAFRTWLSKTERRRPGFDPSEVEDFQLQGLRIFERFREFRRVGRGDAFWIAYLQRYTLDSGLYVVYPWGSTGAALARSWNEAGQGKRSAAGVQADLLEAWDPALVRWSPRASVRLDFNGRVIA